MTQGVDILDSHQARHLLLYGEDCRTSLGYVPNGFVQTVITSPSYYQLRDYGVPGQMGLERTPDEFISALTGTFDDIWRVLRYDGMLWVARNRIQSSHLGYESGYTGFGVIAERRGPSLPIEELFGL